MRIQYEQCTLGDFFGHWMTAFGRVELLEGNMFQKKMLSSMENRQKAMFNNYAVQAALYFDPRYSFNGSTLFSKTQKERVLVIVIINI